MLYKKPLFAYYVIPMIMRPTYQMNDGVLIRYGVCESSVVKVDSKHTHTHNWPIRTFHHCHWHKECEGESMHALRTYISLDSIVVVPFPMLDWFPVVATCYEHTYSHTHTHTHAHISCVLGVSDTVMFTIVWQPCQYTWQWIPFEHTDSHTKWHTHLLHTTIHCRPYTIRGSKWTACRYGRHRSIAN